MPLFQTPDQFVKLDGIGSIQDGVRYKLAHAHTRDLRYDVVQAFKVSCLPPTSLRRGTIQSHVERQHVHARLAKQAKSAILDVLIEELTQALFRHVTRLGNARYLE